MPRERCPVRHLDLALGRECELDQECRYFFVDEEAQGRLELVGVVGLLEEDEDREAEGKEEGCVDKDVEEHVLDEDSVQHNDRDANELEGHEQVQKQAVNDDTIDGKARELQPLPPQRPKRPGPHGHDEDSRAEDESKVLVDHSSDLVGRDITVLLRIEVFWAQSTPLPALEQQKAARYGQNDGYGLGELDQHDLGLRVRPTQRVGAEEVQKVVALAHRAVPRQHLVEVDADLPGAQHHVACVECDEDGVGDDGVEEVHAATELAPLVLDQPHEQVLVVELLDLVDGDDFDGAPPRVEAVQLVLVDPVRVHLLQVQLGGLHITIRPLNLPHVRVQNVSEHVHVAQASSKSEGSQPFVVDLFQGGRPSVLHQPVESLVLLVEHGHVQRRVAELVLARHKLLNAHGRLPPGLRRAVPGQRAGGAGVALAVLLQHLHGRNSAHRCCEGEGHLPEIAQVVVRGGALVGRGSVAPDLNEGLTLEIAALHPLNKALREQELVLVSVGCSRHGAADHGGEEKVARSHRPHVGGLFLAVEEPAQRLVVLVDDGDVQDCLARVRAAVLGVVGVGDEALLQEEVQLVLVRDAQLLFLSVRPLNQLPPQGQNCALVPHAGQICEQEDGV
mmetsp:Transcript_57554/g.141129  ORF Transcript_57554/g.141129 Transcript_57554/m.141129 type:complete len:618 (+) Transcript_57554:687-2540(+)